MRDRPEVKQAESSSRGRLVRRGHVCSLRRLRGEPREGSGAMRTQFLLGMFAGLLAGVAAAHEFAAISSWWCLLPAAMLAAFAGYRDYERQGATPPDIHTLSPEVVARIRAAYEERAK